MSKAPVYCDFCRGSPILEATENVGLDLTINHPAFAGRAWRFEFHSCVDCRRHSFAPVPSGLVRLQDEFTHGVVTGSVVFNLPLRRLQKKRR